MCSEVHDLPPLNWLDIGQDADDIFSSPSELFESEASETEESSHNYPWDTQMSRKRPKTEETADGSRARGQPAPASNEQGTFKPSPPTSPTWALRKRIGGDRGRAEADGNTLQLVVRRITGEKTTHGLLKVPKDLRSRWSDDRYEACQLKLYQILKEKNARIGNAISRSELREYARKHIGDTGLLDHLLKHLTDRVIAENQRFRRRHNTEGAMEYWLEDAGLMELRKAAGVTDPTWVPPRGWKPGDPVPLHGSQGMTPAERAQMDELVHEVQCMKSEVQLLSSKEREEPLLLTGPDPSPGRNGSSSDANKNEIKDQMEALKASIEELQNAYDQLHALQQESISLSQMPPENTDPHKDSREQAMIHRLDKLEQEVQRLAQGQTQFPSLWKAVLALQDNMASLVAAIQPVSVLRPQRYQQQQQQQHWGIQQPGLSFVACHGA